MFSRISSAFGCHSATPDALPRKPILDALGGAMKYNVIPLIYFSELNFTQTENRLVCHQFNEIEDRLSAARNPLAIFQATIQQKKWYGKTEKTATFIVIKVLDKMSQAHAQLKAILIQKSPEQIYFCHIFTDTEQLTCVKVDFQKSLAVIQTLINKGSLAHFPAKEKEYPGDVLMVTPDHEQFKDLSGRITLYDFAQEMTEEKSDDEKIEEV